MATKKEESKKTRIEISGNLYELSILPVSDSDFKKYAKKGLPEDDGEDESSDFYDELIDSIEDSGLECSDMDSISLSVNGKEVKNFSNLIKTESETTFYPVKRWQSSGNCVVRYQSGASASWELEIKGEFDFRKLAIGIYRYQLPDSSMISELSPSYDGLEFEYQDGSGFDDSEMYLVNKKGEIIS